MRATTDKDYIDARDAALMTALREQSALYDAHRAEQSAMDQAYRAEMEARWNRTLTDLYKWVAGIVLAGVTVSTSVTGYMLNSALGQLQTEIRKIQQAPSPSPQPAPPPAPIIIYPPPAPMR
ncbi:hypothetical protein ACEN9F_03140 [Duganella sp. CT11-25]|uniref:hypothetical protein n=1 Tax=unclassified Duganella TaxID=2636909 RepID=UPI0039AEDE38